MAADMWTNYLVRDLDDHDLSVLHTRNTQNGLVGVACVNPLQKKFRGGSVTMRDYSFFQSMYCFRFTQRQITNNNNKIKIKIKKNN